VRRVHTAPAIAIRRFRRALSTGGGYSMGLRSRCLFVFLLVNLSMAADAAPLSCDSGPIARTYGKTSWLIYGCNDGQSVVIVSAPGNPVAPFYFLVHPSAEGHRIEGEGTGSRATTDAALAEIKTLTDADIAALIESAKRAKNPN
jgi:hypothetical protein